MKYGLALLSAAVVFLVGFGDCQRGGSHGQQQRQQPARGVPRQPSADSAEEAHGRRRERGPCRVVDVASNATVESRECPTNSSCDYLDPLNPNPNVKIYLCSPPADGPCKIVDVATNATTVPRTCPTNSTCDFLDLMNPNPNFKVYLCSPPAFPLRQPCKVIDLTANTTTEGPAVCPANSTCSVLERFAAQPNVQNVYCSNPFDREFGVRSPLAAIPCRSTDVATNVTTDIHRCPPASTCTVLDTANTDPTVVLYLCTPHSLMDERHRGGDHSRRGGF